MVLSIYETELKPEYQDTPTMDVTLEMFQLEVITVVKKVLKLGGSVYYHDKEIFTKTIK
jgi:hypothetical protein